MRADRVIEWSRQMTLYEVNLRFVSIQTPLSTGVVLSGKGERDVSDAGAPLDEPDHPPMSLVVDSGV